MTTTITNFYKFVENIDGIDSNIKENVLEFLNEYGKEHKDFDFDAEDLEHKYIDLYTERRFNHRTYPFTDAEDYSYYKLFRYQYSFINLVRDYLKANEYNPTERNLIKFINKSADEDKKMITDAHIEGGYEYNSEIDRDAVKKDLKKYLSGDDVQFRYLDCYIIPTLKQADLGYIIPILNKVEAEIEDMIDEGQIKTKKDLWDNLLRLMEIDIIPQIKNPLRLCAFWEYVAKVYYDF